jgi:hypothetical protein
MADSGLISKFIASAASVQNELQLAVASLNLDFTLIRLEAPKEFNGVNQSLTEYRRENAESGALHRTARKLGALFDGVPPQCPELLAAYGKRVSEICETQNIDPKERARHGIFSRFAGADSASLWAAATSGTNAIAVHLLACMIAEVFDDVQAVSIWWELIQRRKLEIERTIENEPDQIKRMAMALVTKQDFSRAEIGTWDNSCRSWIQTANSARASQRKVALLNTDRAGAKVNVLPDTYQSVIQAWKDAMVSINALVKGIPQKVRNGAVLLAMNAWHLYPDLCVLSKGPNIIHQNDALVDTSGILTIDLESSSDSAGSIVWSLPLSYLRHYGEPVIITQRISFSLSRISMDDFRYVLLGCTFSTWTGFTQSVTDAMGLMSQLNEALRWPDRASKHNADALERMQKIVSKTSWIGQLVSAVDDFVDGSDLEKDTARKLIEHGRRHGDFLCGESHPAPFFSLSHIPSLFSLLADSPEPRIAYLRQYAKDIGLSNRNCVIRYNYSGSQYEFASLEPIGADFQPHEQGYLRQPKPFPQKHVRWILLKGMVPHACSCKDACSLGPREEDPESAKAKIKFPWKSGRVKGPVKPCPCLANGHCSVLCHGWKNMPCMDASMLSRIEYICDLGEHCLPARRISSPADPKIGQFEFGTGLDFRSALQEFCGKSPLGIPSIWSECFEKRAHRRAADCCNHP